MFTNEQVFKRLIKKAWNTQGLIVAATEEEYVIMGGYWILRVNQDSITNKAKAAIIELTGEMPKEGRVFRALKDCENDYDVQVKETWDFESQMRQAGIFYTVTKILRTTSKVCRILQNPRTQNCILLGEEFIDLVDRNKINFDKESDVVGPMAVSENSRMVYWKNSCMSLMACTVVPSEKDTNEAKALLQLLSNMEWEAEDR